MNKSTNSVGLLLASILLVITESASAVLVGSDGTSLVSFDEITGHLTGEIDTRTPRHTEFEFMPDGTVLLVSDVIITRYDPVTGSILGSYGAGAGIIDAELTDTGLLLVYDSTGHIRQFDPLTGAYAGPSFFVGEGALDIEVTANEVLVGIGSAIERYSLLYGGYMGNIFTGMAIKDMELTASGDILVSDWDVMQEFSLLSGAPTDFQFDPELPMRNNFEIAANGDIFVSDGISALLRYSATGTFLDVAFTSAGLRDIEFLPAAVPIPAVPIPAAVWLFGSGLLGLVGMTRRKKAA